MAPHSTAGAPGDRELVRLHSLSVSPAPGVSRTVLSVRHALSHFLGLGFCLSSWYLSAGAGSETRGAGQLVGAKGVRIPMAAPWVLLSELL